MNDHQATNFNHTLKHYLSTYLSISRRLVRKFSEWQSDGCKLVATNRTHSICACNHLASFALLSEWEEPLQQFSFGSNTETLALPSQPTNSAEGTQINGQNHPANSNQQEQPKLQLDSIENQLILPNKLLYLAKVSFIYLLISEPLLTQRIHLARSRFK